MKTFSRYEQGVDFKAPTWSCSRQETPSDPMKASSWPEPHRVEVWVYRCISFLLNTHKKIQRSVLDQETTNPKEYVKSPFTEAKWREEPGSVFTPFLGLQADI